MNTLFYGENLDISREYIADGVRHGEWRVMGWWSLH